MAATTAAGDLEVKSETVCFGGRLLKCVHQSKATKTPMTFTVFLPPQAAASGPLPVSRTCMSDWVIYMQRPQLVCVTCLQFDVCVLPCYYPSGVRYVWALGNVHWKAHHKLIKQQQCPKAPKTRSRY